MAEQNERERLMAERQAQLRTRMPRMPVVRVEPANDILRRAIRHPRGPGFPPAGAVEWPLDKFTQRRIDDGTVKVVSEPKAAPAKTASN